MLLWLNGPFGGGKTQTAHEIQRRLPACTGYGDVIVPMTVIEPAYLEEILGPLRASGDEFDPSPAIDPAVIHTLAADLGTMPRCVRCDGPTSSLRSSRPH